MIKVLSVFLFACVGLILGQFPGNNNQQTAEGRYQNLNSRNQFYNGQQTSGGQQPRNYDGQQFGGYGRQYYGGQQLGGYNGQRSGADRGQQPNGYYDYSEPANYEFGYQVSDPQSQVEFGHQEQRQGDITQGSYQVLLPDGRRQHVQYTADQDGYRPVVSYNDDGSSATNYHRFSDNRFNYGGNSRSGGSDQYRSGSF